MDKTSMCMHHGKEIFFTRLLLKKNQKTIGNNKFFYSRTAIEEGDMQMSCQSHSILVTYHVHDATWNEQNY